MHKLRFRISPNVSSHCSCRIEAYVGGIDVLVLENAKDSGGLRLCELALDAKIGDLQQQIFHEFNEKHSDCNFFLCIFIEKTQVFSDKTG